MKKLIFLFALFTILGESVFAQTLNLMYSKKETDNYMPINSQRVYSAILTSSLDKKDLIDKTKDLFILEGLANASDLKTVVYDENLSEYKIHFGYRHGQAKAKGMMGAAFLAPPVILTFDAIFSFNNLGQIKITFTNFDSHVYAFADEGNYLNSYKGGKGDGKNSNPLPADTLVINEGQMILMTETGIGKALLWANGGLAMLQANSRGEFRKKLVEQFQMYDNAMKKGSTVLISKANISDYKSAYNKYWNDQVAKFKADNFVLAVDNYRWDNYFEMNFNYFFKEIANRVAGQIDKVALNGEIKFENVDGKVLPTDPKERSTWIKKGINF